MSDPLAQGPLIPPAPSVNPDLSAAMAAYRKGSSPDAFTGVLRQLLQGDVLIDATGSDLPADGRFAVGDGASLTLRTLTQNNDRKLLLAFTNADYAIHTHPDPVELRLILEKAANVLQLVARGGFDGLVLDAEDGRWVLTGDGARKLVENYSNYEVKEAVARRDENRVSAVLMALSLGGRLFLPTERKNIEALQAGESVATRAVTSPQGVTFLAAFTSALEANVSFPEDAALQIPLERVLSIVGGNSDLSGLVINIAGPSIELNKEQLVHLL